MMTPERIGSAVMPVVTIAASIFLVTFVYGILSHSDFEDDDTVTVSFSCAQVLGAEEQYPVFVVQQCKKLRNK